MTKTSSASKKAAKTTGTAMTPPAPMTPTAPMAAQEPRQTKMAMLRARLAEPGGVSAAALIALTGWLPHTLRAALSGLRKSGLTIIRRQEGGETFYSIVAAAVVVAENAAAALAVEKAVTGVADVAVEGAAAGLAEGEHPVDADGDGLAQPPLAPLPTSDGAIGAQP